MESCPNWSGDGDVCPCAVFGLERPKGPCMACEFNDCAECDEYTISNACCCGRPFGL